MNTFARPMALAIFALGISVCFAQSAGKPPEAQAPTQPTTTQPPAKRAADEQTQSALAFAEILPIIIDPAKFSGETWVSMHNTGKTEKTVVLKSGAFEFTPDSTKDTKVKLAAQTTLSYDKDTAPVIVLKMPADGWASVKLSVSGYSLVGESVMQLDIDGAKQAIVARQSTAPFNVSLASETPNKPKIQFLRGASGSITLKNDDALNYLVRWCMFIPGESTPIGGTKLLPAKSQLPVQVSPPDAWFSHGFEGLFKNRVREGKVTLSIAESAGTDLDCPAAQKETAEADKKLQTTSPSSAPPGTTFPSHTQDVQLDLAYWDGMKIFGYVVLLLLLAAGAALSTLFNLWIPSLSRRDMLLKKLEDLAEAIRRIRRDSDSRLRVVTRVRRLQLFKELNKFFMLRLDAEHCIDEFQTDIDQLTKRIAYSIEVSEAEQRVRELRTRRQLPSISMLETIGSQLNEAAHILYQPAITDDELTTAKGLIDSATKIFPSIGMPDADLAGRLKMKFDKLKASFDSATGESGKTQTGQEFANSNPLLLGTFSDSRFTDPTTMDPEDYGDLEVRLALLDQLDLFVRLATGIAANASDTVGDKLRKDLQEEMADVLQRIEYGSIARAEYVVLQLRDRVTFEDIAKALRDEAIDIRWDPIGMRANEPVRMNVEFRDERLQRSNVRYAFRCHWRFAPKVGDETNWTIAHFFRHQTAEELKKDPDETKFAVEFTGPDGVLLQTAANTTLNIPPAPPLQLLAPFDPRKLDQNWAEFWRLILAIVFAVIGLIAGAYEQFMKVDIFFGLLGVVALGFGADTIKNLFLKKP